MAARARRLLLLQRLLGLRDGAGPFTLLLDSLEQSAQPVVDEVVARAKAAKTKIILIAFQTVRAPPTADVFIVAHRLSLPALRQEMAPHLCPAAPGLKTLIVIDSLYHLASTSAAHLTSFLGSLLRPNVFVLATYHTDVPVARTCTTTAFAVPPEPPLAICNPYAPDPLTALSFLATAILRTSSLSHVIEKKRARDRSRAEPEFGLAEGRDGVLVGLKSVHGGADEVVIELETRRKSGRAVREEFVLNPNANTNANAKAVAGKLCLLEDHPLLARPSLAAGGGEEEGAWVETTFSLGLTDKQRRDREGVVLPYFDAQRGQGGGDGGRILYEMDRADDFDDEEDEI